MSVDRRLREGLRASADALTPDPLGALRTVEHKAQRQRRRILVVQLVAAAAAIALVFVALPWSLTQLRGPASVAPPAPTSVVAGQYVVDIEETTLTRTEGMAGRWIVRLAADGAVVFVPPDSFPGTRAGTSYQIDGDQLRTNAFVNDVCGSASAATPVGTYRWTYCNGYQTRCVPLYHRALGVVFSTLCATTSRRLPTQPRPPGWRGPRSGSTQHTGAAPT
jgi:hypothetical protein